MNSEELASRIHQVEGFTVEIEYDSDNLKGYRNRLCADDDNVKAWRKLFGERYPGAKATVLLGNGDIAHGRYHLSNLRRTYHLEYLRSEINTLKLKLQQAESQSINEQDESLQRAYTILGVATDSDQREVKGAYFRKIKIFHPDTIQYLVSENRLHEEFLFYANEKCSEINRAYELLQKTGADPEQAR